MTRPAAPKPPTRPVTPVPAGPATPRTPKNHYVVNGRPYLAELDLLTWCALDLADHYEKKLTALFARPTGQVGVR